MHNNSVSVVIPLFNEEKRIGRTFERIREYSTNSGLIKEIILVDDGSTDDTQRVLYGFEDFALPIKILKNEKNMGKGFSVKRGINEASGEAILFMDADNSVDISYLDSFLKYADSADIVIGSIEAPGARIMTDENHPLRRKLGRFAKKLINQIAVKGVYDTQRGFKLFSRRAADIIFPRQTINRFGFDIEILLIAQKHGLKIKEMPVLWNNPKSTSVNFMSYIQTLLELLRIKWNDIRRMYK